MLFLVCMLIVIVCAIWWMIDYYLKYGEHDKDDN